MAETFRYVKGDNGPQLQVVLTNEDDDTPVNLTGGTVTLHFRAAGETTVLFSRDFFISTDNAPLGIAILQWQDNDLDVGAGVYEGEIEVVRASGLRETLFEKLKFRVRDEFA
jgi:hypothetical protein